MLRVLLPLVALGLTLWAAFDLVRRPDAEVRLLPRPAWFVLVLVLPLAGPLAYAVLGRGPDAGQLPPRHRPLGPDDDEDFLRSL
ncbi:MAG TPA: PLD nuclease N-terminal domain-containing protein [Motilibacteraceae bacterium]|nr:PLD nuclease N-terminal domain-containing protein [Motilibacteraceae bacterium]